MNKILNGDCLEVMKGLKSESINCCTTSPPYWGLRDYGAEGQLGLEKTAKAYVDKLVEIFREVRRILRDDGTLWLNLGDSYAGSMKGIGHDGNAYAGEKQDTNKGSVGIYKEKPPSAQSIGLKPKDLVGIPWMVAFALRADGWYLRSDIIWHKPNAMPESVKDRPTKAHEYIFLLSKSKKYYYDYEAIKEPAKWERWGNQTEKKKHPGKAAHLGGKKIEELPVSDKKNKRTVWAVPTKPFKEAHFATYPPDLIEPCILAGCPEGGIVLDPFMGAGTTAMVTLQNRRRYIGVEINPEYVEIAERRLAAVQMKIL